MLFDVGGRPQAPAVILKKKKVVGFWGCSIGGTHFAFDFGEFRRRVEVQGSAMDALTRIWDTARDVNECGKVS